MTGININLNKKFIKINIGKYLIVLLILFIIFYIITFKSIVLYGQQSDDNSEDEIFSEESFDKEFERKKEEAKQNTFSYLFGGSINFTNSFYYYKEFENYYSNGTLSGNIFGVISFLSILKLYVKYNYSYNLYYFTDNLGKFPNKSELNNFKTSLSEFFFDYNILPYIFIRVGKQLISWGPSFLWTPVDFINLEKYNFLSSEDTRGGKPGVRVHFPINKINFFLFWDLYGLDSGIVNYDIKKTGLGTRLDFTLAGFEIGFTGYFRKDNKPKIGVDFSGTLFNESPLNVDIYGEFSYYNDYFIKGIKKANFPILLEEILPSLPSIQFVFGIMKSFLNDKSLSISLTIFYNSQGHKIENLNEVIQLIIITGKTLNNYLIPFYYGKYYIASSITKSKLLNNHLSAGINFYGNLTDETYILIFSTSWNFGDYPTINFKISYNFGRDDGEFTYPYNNVITLSLNTGVSF